MFVPYPSIIPMITSSSSVISHVSSTRLVLKTLKMSKSVMEGTKVGLSLVTISELFSHQHNPYAMIIQVLLGMYAYGMDRMTEKERQNGSLYLFYETLLILDVILLSRNFKTIPLIPLLYSTKYYRYIKKHLGIIKPGVIAVMWALCCVLLPHMVGNNLIDPYQPIQFLGCYLAVYGTSNFADLRDMEEDKDAGIMTIPVLYKEEITVLVATFSCIASVFCLLIEFYLRTK